MFESLDETVARHAQVIERLFQPDLPTKEIQELNKERARLEPVVNTYQAWLAKEDERRGNQALLEEKDPELRALAREEIARLEPELLALKEKLQELLLPRDPMDDKNVILEIRAGTGGDEAAIFAGDLFAMYSRYAGTHGWRVDVLTGMKGNAPMAQLSRLQSLL